MAKAKKDHVLIGKTFTVKGQIYRVQDIQEKIVFASKMVDDKTCQRGRPSKFDLTEVVGILGISLQTLEAEAAQAAKPVIKAKPKPEEIVEEVTTAPTPPTPVSPTPEELEAKRKSVANLIAMFANSSTSSDW